jgi:hypothetical protein
MQNGGGWPKGQTGQQVTVSNALPPDQRIPVAMVQEEHEREWEITLAGIDSFGAGEVDQAGWQAEVQWGNQYAQETALADWPYGGATFCVAGSLVRLTAVSRYGSLGVNVVNPSSAQSRGWISPALGLSEQEMTWTTGMMQLTGGGPGQARVPVARRARAYRVVGWLDVSGLGTPIPDLPWWPLEWASQAKRVLAFSQIMGPAAAPNLLATDWMSDQNASIAGVGQPISPYLALDRRWMPLNPRTTNVQVDYLTAGGAGSCVANFAIQYLLDMG